MTSVEEEGMEIACTSSRGAFIGTLASREDWGTTTRSGYRGWGRANGYTNQGGRTWGRRGRAGIRWIGGPNRFWQGCCLAGHKEGEGIELRWLSRHRETKGWEGESLRKQLAGRGRVTEEGGGCIEGGSTDWSYKGRWPEECQGWVRVAARGGEEWRIYRETSRGDVTDGWRVGYPLSPTKMSKGWHHQAQEWERHYLIIASSQRIRNPPILDHNGKAVGREDGEGDLVLQGSLLSCCTRWPMSTLLRWECQIPQDAELAVSCLSGDEGTTTKTRWTLKCKR